MLTWPQVAVVPIISKADTFTAKEMEAFRAELLQVCVLCGNNAHTPCWLAGLQLHCSHSLQQTLAGALGCLDACCCSLTTPAPR